MGTEDEFAIQTALLHFIEKEDDLQNLVCEKQHALDLKQCSKDALVPVLQSERRAYANVAVLVEKIKALPALKQHTAPPYSVAHPKTQWSLVLSKMQYLLLQTLSCISTQEQAILVGDAVLLQQQHKKQAELLFSLSRLVDAHKPVVEKITERYKQSFRFAYGSFIPRKIAVYLYATTLAAKALSVQRAKNSSKPKII